MKRNTGKAALYALALTAGLGITLAATTAHADNYEWKTFTDWDADQSGFIEDGEFRNYAFTMADWDEDGYLEKTEWVSYTKNFWDPYGLDYDSYTYYDTDGDGYIERTEFNEFAVMKGGLYERWDDDKDNRISEQDWDKVTVYYYDYD